MSYEVLDFISIFLMEKKAKESKDNASWTSLMYTKETYGPHILTLVVNASDFEYWNTHHQHPILKFFYVTLFRVGFFTLSLPYRSGYHYCTTSLIKVCELRFCAG